MTHNDRHPCDCKTARRAQTGYCSDILYANTTTGHDVWACARARVCVCGLGLTCPHARLSSRAQLQLSSILINCTLRQTHTHARTHEFIYLCIIIFWAIYKNFYIYIWTMYKYKYMYMYTRVDCSNTFHFAQLYGVLVQCDSRRLNLFFTTFHPGEQNKAIPTYFIIGHKMTSYFCGC